MAINKSGLSSGIITLVEKEDNIPAIIKPSVTGNLKRQVMSVTNATVNKILYITLNWVKDDNEKHEFY